MHAVRLVYYAVALSFLVFHTSTCTTLHTLCCLYPLRYFICRLTSVPLPDYSSDFCPVSPCDLLLLDTSRVALGSAVINFYLPVPNDRCGWWTWWSGSSQRPRYFSQELTPNQSAVFAANILIMCPVMCCCCVCVSFAWFLFFSIYINYTQVLKLIC